MSSVVIKKVETRKELDAFIQLHYDLYRGNPYDAPNLYSDELNTFRKDKNSAFDFCEGDYFLAYKDGKVVGRVAAIINHRYNKQWDRPAVRFGWLDLIDDIDVLRALLTTVEDYGRERGMKEIIGPLGFTDMDPEGMLTKGFEELGTMATGYNYAYYPELMKQMEGYEKDNDYVEYKLFVPKEGMPEKFKKIAEMIMQRYNLHTVKIKRSQIPGPDGYGKKVFDGFHQLLNNPLNVIVFNFVDMLSHAGTDVNVVRELADDEKSYRSVTASWFANSVLFDMIKWLAERKIPVMITTDHGTIKVDRALKMVGERDLNTNLRYKVGRSSMDYPAKEVFEIKNPDDAFLPKETMTQRFIFATKSDFFAYQNNFNQYVNLYKNTFQHGGISMEEMMIPFVILSPKNS